MSKYHDTIIRQSSEITSLHARLADMHLANEWLKSQLAAKTEECDEWEHSAFAAQQNCERIGKVYTEAVERMRRMEEVIKRWVAAAKSGELMQPSNDIWLIKDSAAALSKEEPVAPTTDQKPV